ncbi:MAG: SDR family oxidoreductase [Alphaproteobacteria bacterium]|nr:SDR family oxidoreductase [Alphaproteobacteria bacterium]
MNKAHKRLFCFGYGYCAGYLADALRQDASWTVGGSTRSEDRRKEMLGARIRARIFDIDHPIADPETFFNRLTHVLISIPPGDYGDEAFRLHAQDFVNLPNLEWVGYLSSTTVYGDRGGGSVDEYAEIRPTSKRGSRRAKAETQWMSLFKQHNVPVHIFRLSGIYGPGRSVLDSVRAAMPRRIEKPGHVFNRIHVEDIIQVLKASIEKPDPGSIYNLADDLPTPSHELIAYACELLGMEVPPLIPFEEADLAPITVSFYKDNKHVVNEKVKSELDVKLKYPDYTSGLKRCLEVDRAG